MKDDHVAVLLEDMNSKFDVVIESVSGLASGVKELKQLIPDVTELKSDVKVIKAAVTDQTTQLNDHENRITAIEAV
jgi:hypothetical protein